MPRQALLMEPHLRVQSARAELAHVRTHLPLLTIAAVLATTIGAAAQLVDPSVFGALRRNPDALPSGEWWRIVTPLLVLDGNLWLHYPADTLMLVVVGATLEWHVGAPRWAVLFAAGALVGQSAGYAWDPSGAGASVAICGLIGGLAVVQLVDHRLHLVASLFCIGLVAALASATVITALGGDGVIASIGVVVICAILINVLMLMYRRSADPRFAVTYVLAVVTGGALVLLASLDNHGAALLAGIAVGVVLFGWRSSRPSREAVGASS